MEIRELTHNVFVLLTKIGDLNGDSNFGLIIGDNGVVLIDADIRRWDEIKKHINRITKKPIKYLINTHDNFDHTSANTVLTRMGVVVIASKTCYEIMVKRGKIEFFNKMKIYNDLKDKYELDELSLPDITFNDKLYLNVGKRTLELYFVGPAHTPGDLIAYLP